MADVAWLRSGDSGAELPHSGNNKKNAAKLGLLLRTPRRRRAAAASAGAGGSLGKQEAQQLLTKSWDGGLVVHDRNHQGPASSGKSTWSGWRSLRKISDTLIDYALNEPYKADSVFSDDFGSAAVYRSRADEGARTSKTMGHAQGRATVSCPPPFFCLDFFFRLDFFWTYFFIFQFLLLFLAIFLFLLTLRVNYCLMKFKMEIVLNEFEFGALCKWPPSEMKRRLGRRHSHNFGAIKVRVVPDCAFNCN